MNKKDQEFLSSLPSSRLVSNELLPTTRADRHISNMEFLWMWIGMSILLAVFANAANLFPSLGIGTILLAVIVGNAITCITLALTGDIGVTHGISFAVYLRAIYGYSGTHIPSFIRALPACFWFGFQTFLGAEAINLILMRLTSWPGTYGHVLGIIIVFLILQVVTTAGGIKTIAKFEKFVTPFMLIVVAYLLYWVLTQFGLTAREIIATPAAETVEGTRYTFAYAVTAMTGFWATMALNIPDLTRHLRNVDPLEKKWFKRNWNAIWPQWLGIIPMMGLFAFIGAAAMLGSGEWNPVTFIATMDAPLALSIVILLLSAFAQWSTNIASNILPPANIFTNIFAPKVNFAWSCVIAGILAFVMQPWAIADYVVNVNAYVGIMLGAVAGTMVSDYYFLRKRKLNIKDLYVEGGQYRYAKNFNPAAFIAYIVGFVAGMLWQDWGFLFAGLVGGVVYFVLMKFWIVKKYPQAEVDGSLELDNEYV